MVTESLNLFNRDKIPNTEINKYHKLLKQKIAHYLLGFREKFTKYPIDQVKKFKSHPSYKEFGKVNIEGENIEGKILVDDIQNKYKDLNKKANPSYFNYILKNYKLDASKCKKDENQKLKSIYSSYDDELKMDFKQMDMDFDFLVSGIKEINKHVTQFNKNNITKESEDCSDDL